MSAICAHLGDQEGRLELGFAQECLPVEFRTDQLGFDVCLEDLCEALLDGVRSVNFMGRFQKRGKGRG